MRSQRRPPATTSTVRSVDPGHLPKGDFHSKEIAMKKLFIL